MHSFSKWIKTAAYSLGLLLLASQLNGCGKKSDLTLPDEPQKQLSGFTEHAPKQ
ncbi:Lipoprotein [uncultured Thiomicrorhabdus sp.]|jgi:predicted small lipoprotein YifL